MEIEIRQSTTACESPSADFAQSLDGHVTRLALCFDSWIIATKPRGVRIPAKSSFKLKVNHQD